MKTIKLTRIIQIILIVLLIIVGGVIIVGSMSNNNSLGTNVTLCEFGCGTAVKFSRDNQYHGDFCTKCNKFSTSKSESHILEEKARKIEGTDTHGWYKECTECGYEGANYRIGICTMNSDGECIYCKVDKTNNINQEIEEIKIVSEVYTVDGLNISNVQTETTVSQLKENIQTNATEAKIYNSNNEEVNEEEFAGTGMKLELKFENEVIIYTLIVKGDVTGDGLVKMNDISRINKARLHKEGYELEGIYLTAADITEDGELDLREIDKINKFRLKIAEEI